MLLQALPALRIVALQVGGGKPDEFAAELRKDTGIYAKIIKDANIKLN